MLSIRYFPVACLMAGAIAVAGENRQDRLTIDQAVGEAMKGNLALLAQRYDISVADAALITARLRPNPVFSAGADYLDLLGTDFNSVNNAGPSEVNFRTDFLLERGGKRERRVDLAGKAKDVVLAQFLNATRLLILDVQNACVDVLVAKANLALAEETLKTFDSIVEINTARVAAGDLAEVELVRSRVARLQYRNAVMQAEARLKASRNHLQTLLGRSSISPDFDVVGELKADSQPADLGVLKARALESRPDLKALLKNGERLDADLRLQQAQAKVDYTLGSEYHRQFDNASGNSLGFFISVPLPFFNRNQGEIERASQEKLQNEVRIRALQVDIRTEIENAYLQYLTSRELLANIEKDMLSQARDVRDTTAYSYRRGEASFVEFLDAQRAFNDTMQGYNDAKAEFVRSIFLIESVTGNGVNP